MPSRNPDESQPDEPAVLAALADGSLAGDEREALEARVAADPELQARLAEQERALSLVRAAVADVEAPARLRARIESRRRAAERRRFLPIAGIAVAAAVVLLAVVAVWPSTGGPSVAQAAELGLLPPTAAAPPVSSTQPKLLAAAQDGVAFPAWQTKFGWRSVGQRIDRLKGRSTRTVYYEKGGKRIAYTIVGGDPLDEPSDGTTTQREGTPVRVLHQGQRTIATWRREGHTCILVARGVPDATLVKLAAWHGLGTVPF